ncbi:MAG: hypothetical protein CM15mP51_01760 [Porticoccaceae bacterium]|nr:MAG: hypothetical protein CM15mP51_01760 [Porticoccaceae bacterium]
MAQLAVASANGRAMEPNSFRATTIYLKSDINEANYHSVTFRNLEPNTLYAYRVGDGVNFTNIIISKLQTKTTNLSVLYILGMLKMKSGRIGQEFFELFAMLLELPSRFMRVIW